MTKKSICALSIGSLVLVNIVMIVFLLKGKHGQSNGEGPKKEITEMLHLDKIQIQKYEILIADHQKKIQQADQNLYKLKEEIFASLNRDLPQASIDSMLDKIGQAQSKIEGIHYDHFTQLKKLLRPKQLPYFEKLSKKLGQLFQPKGPNGPNQRG